MNKIIVQPGQVWTYRGVNNVTISSVREGYAYKKDSNGKEYKFGPLDSVGFPLQWDKAWSFLSGPVELINQE